jgi:hypothetical protein
MGMMEIAFGVALGIILAVVVLRFWALIGWVIVVGAFVLLVLGLFVVYVGVPVYKSYSKVTVENPEAPFVLAGIIGFFSALAVAYYWWTNRPTKAKAHVIPSASKEG